MDLKYAEAVEGARAALRTAALEQRTAPQLFRLACHDAWTYDQASKTGGANGSIRTERELSHAANKGLSEAMKVIESCKQKYQVVGYADLIQLGGIVSLEVMGGPAVAFTPGRKDSRVSPPQGRLPRRDPSAAADACKGVLPRAFSRMGLSPRHWVALAAVHPLGLCWGQPPSQLEGSWDPAMSALDNTFFKALLSQHGPPVSSDATLLEDSTTRALVELYAQDEAAWRSALAEAVALASTLGTDLKPPPASSASGAAAACSAKAAARSSGGGGGGASLFGGAGGGIATLTTSQIAAGAAVAAAIGAAVGYYFGRRRRFRF